MKPALVGEFNAAASSTSSMRPRARRLSDQFPRFWGQYTDPNQKWQLEVLSQMLKYARMDQGWNSYGAPPVRWDAGLFALSVLDRVMLPRTPIPQIVPSGLGGVQLEWHERDIDLELHVTSPYECELWFEDHRKPNEPPKSEELSSDLSSLAAAIELLTSR